MTEKIPIIIGTVIGIGLLLSIILCYVFNKYFKCCKCKSRYCRGCLRKCNICLYIKYRSNTYDTYQHHPKTSTTTTTTTMIHPITVVIDPMHTPSSSYIPPQHTIINMPNNTTILSPNSNIGVAPYNYPTSSTTTVGYPSTISGASYINRNPILTVPISPDVCPLPTIPSNASTVTTTTLLYPSLPTYYIAPSVPITSGSSPVESMQRLPSLPVIEQPGTGIIPTVSPSTTVPSTMASMNKEQQRLYRIQMEQTIIQQQQMNNNNNVSNELYTYPIEQGKQWYNQKQQNQLLLLKAQRKKDTQFEDRLILLALLRSRWAHLTAQELADYVRRIAGLSIPFNPQDPITASTAKEAIWEALVRWAQDRSHLPSNVAMILTRSFEIHHPDTLKDLCQYLNLPITGRPLDLWDRLESYYSLTSTRPEPALSLRTRPIYARYSKRPASTVWWLREGYTGEEAMPIELATDGTSIYHHSFWLYQDGAIQETSETLDRWFPVLSKEQHREWKGNEDDTNSARRKICASVLIRGKCWDEVDANVYTLQLRQYVYQTLGNKYHTELPNHFRADDHGNIISDIAGNNAIARFDPDHAFPWIRGGLTVAENLRALHFAANRWGKKHALIVAEPNMKRGIMVQDFVDLYIAAHTWCEEQPRNSSLLLELSNPHTQHGQVKKKQAVHAVAHNEPATYIDYNIAAWAIVTKVLCRTLEEKNVISDWNDYRHKFEVTKEGWRKLLIDLVDRIKDN